MRYTKYNPKNGEERSVVRFLWWPVTIYGPDGKYDETRWLETVTIRQVYHVYPYLVPDQWENVEFVDAATPAPNDTQTADPSSKSAAASGEFREKE